MESTLTIILELMAGLGLFMYGMKLMGDGLENAAGESLKRILEKVTSNPIKSVIVGAIVTAIIQSSSATTVMVVGFVNAGLMNLTQAAGIIMGANIGTTITAQLVAFKLNDIAPIFIFVGTLIVMFSKGKRRKELGNIVLGFGILFTGMGIMSSSMKPLAGSPMFEHLIISIGDRWYIGVLVGTLITAVLQSSSATTGILVALATAGAIDINIALPIVFGCNIGTCITAIIASIGANKTAHKAAALHLIFNIVGTIVFLPFLGVLESVVLSMNDVVSRQIANAHTIFNVINTLLLLPFSKYIIDVVNKIVPGEDEIDNMGPKYLDDRLLETPVIAVGQVIKETIRLANKSRQNLELSMKAFNEEDEKLIAKVYENEKTINVLEESITAFLVRLSKCELADKEADIVASTFHIVNDIERVGDHAKNIADLSMEKMERNLLYSTDALSEINEIYGYTMNALEKSINSYKSNNYELARDVQIEEDKIDICEKQFRDKHIKRLNDGKCNAYAGALFLDLIANFERIGDHAMNISQSVIENNI